MAKIGAIILAAGESSRFGAPKQLLQIRGKTLLRRMVEAAASAQCSPIVVVTGNVAGKIREELTGVAVSIVENENWQSGLGTSIRSGAQHLTRSDDDVGAIILLVCDQPFVDAQTIKGLIAVWEKSKKAIVASSYANTLGVPTLFDRSCFDELLKLPDDSGAKPIIVSNPDRVATFPFQNGAIDIDTMEDWNQFVADNQDSLG